MYEKDGTPCGEAVLVLLDNERERETCLLLQAIVGPPPPLLNDRKQCSAFHTRIMSEKRESDGSAHWRLTSLFRPIPQSLLPQSNRSSQLTIRDIAGPHLSLLTPALLSRIGSTSPESDTVQLTQRDIPRPESVYSVKSPAECSPSDVASTFRTANDEIDEHPSHVQHRYSRSTSEPAKPRQKTISQYSVRTPSSRASISTYLVKPPEARDTTFLVELPAAVPSLRCSIRSSRASLIDAKTGALLEKSSAPPPLPIKPLPKSIDLEKAEPQPRHLDEQVAPGNTINWPKSRKWASTSALGFVAFCIAFASSVLTPVSNVASQELGISKEAMVLATTLFLVGLSIGPLLWSPLNELCGRRTTLLVGLVGFAIMQVPCALAQNSSMLLVCRFIGGVFAASSLMSVIVSLTESWTSLDRRLAMTVFSAAMLIGICVGAVVGGPLADSTVLGWRWTSWIVLILCFPFGLACAICHQESSAEVQMRRRAKRSQSTPLWRPEPMIAKTGSMTGGMMRRHVCTPIWMFMTDPILCLITVYMAFSDGVFYWLLEAWQISFHDERHWPLKLAGLPFVSVIVGVCIGCAASLVLTRIRFRGIVRKHGRLCPEERLLPMVAGSIALPVGLFLFTWTASPAISPIPAIAAGVLLGFGFLLTFLQGSNFIVGVYAAQATSAMAINTSIRFLTAAAFAAFAGPMCLGLQPQWAGTLLGTLAILFIPLPILFFKFGVKLRAMSRFTPKLTAGSSPVVGFPAQQQDQ